MPIPALLPVAPPIPASTADRPNISITGGDGVFWDLTNLDARVLLMPGHTGFDAPPTTAFVDGTPGLPGAAWQGSHDDARTISIPVYLEGSTRSEAVALRRALVSSVHHTRGLATVCVAEPDGYRRYLQCVYTGGAEGAEGTDNAGLAWCVYTLLFAAYDNPYWFGDVVTPTPWTVASPQAFFPLKPAVFTLSSSQVLGGTLIDNTGDVDAYPVWTLKGPATSLTLTLGSETVVVNSTLSAGQTLIIDTDPRSQTITDGTGANRWADVASGFDLWALPPGVNAVTVTVGGGGAATQLSVAYQPRYLKS